MRLNGLHRPSAPSVERDLSSSFFSVTWKSETHERGLPTLFSFFFYFALFSPLSRTLVRFSRRAFSLSLVHPIEPLVPRYKIVSCYKLESLGETFRPIKILLRLLLRPFVRRRRETFSRTMEREHVLSSSELILFSLCKASRYEMSSNYNARARSLVRVTSENNVSRRRFMPGRKLQKMREGI